MKRGGRMRPTLLLVVHSTALGGAERCALAEAKRLSRSYDLVIAAPEGPLRADFAACGRLVDGPRLLPIWGDSARRWGIQIIRTAFDTLRFARLIRRENVATVVCNSSCTLSPVAAGWLRRRPVVLHLRDSLKSRLGRPLVRLEGRLASTVIAVSEELAMLCGSSGARVVVIPDAIVIPDDRRSQHGFGRLLRLGVIGPIDRGKGQDLAVRALPMLVASGLRVELHLVGREPDPVYASELRATARALGVEGAVRFHGELRDLEPIYAKLDILVLPSRREALGLVVLEALARRLPVVASAVGSVPKLLLDGEAGLLVEPDDPSALAAGVISLRADPNRALALAERGRAHVVRNYDLERSLDLGCAEIARVLGADAGPVGGDGGTTLVPSHLPSNQHTAGSLSSGS
jgi:glycosyltransferase involved in cell wall biosynthesis